MNPLLDSTNLDLCQNAKIFRCKLIDTFSLIDKVGKKSGPKIIGFKDVDKEIPDIGSSGLAHDVLVDLPNLEIKNKKYVTLKEHALFTVEVEYRNKIPLEFWISWIKNSTTWNSLLVWIIIINSITIGIETGFETPLERYAWNRESIYLIIIFLDLINYLCLPLYLTDFFLKWIDGFRDFWTNSWDLFDLSVTLVAISSEIIYLLVPVSSLSEENSWLIDAAQTLRAFRILRILKLIPRVASLRLVALALSRSFRAGIFLSVLFFLFAYIFSIAGLTYFEDYSSSPNPELKFKSSFNGIFYTLATLFRIFTLDGWHDLLEDVLQMKDPIISCFYFISWIIIGAFIFRNLYIGIMVNNFQTIRTELQKEMEEAENTRNAEMRKESFNYELMKQEELLSALNRRSDSLIKISSAPDLNKLDSLKSSPPTPEIKRSREHLEVVGKLNSAISQTLYEGKKWDDYVRKNLDVLSRVPQKTLWPRDTLFVYFQMMESLMENLQERKDLLDYIRKTILHSYNG